MSELKKLAQFCERTILFEKLAARIGFKYPGLFKKKIPFDTKNIVSITPNKRVVKEVSNKPVSAWDRYTESWNKNPMATGAATAGGLLVADRVLS